MSNTATKQKILVVDDSPVMRKGIIDLLSEKFSVEFLEAGDGREAVRMYKECKPDLVTLDVNMPEMDGMQALEEIIRIDPEARIIMLTTEAEKQKIIEAVSLGAKSYIVKPIDREKAQVKVANALKT